MPPTTKTNVKNFISDLAFLDSLPKSRLQKWTLLEYPFDSQLLNASPLYLQSRKFYLNLGGCFYPRICSTMRGLSAQDLFKNSIDYTPSASELIWFYKNAHDVTDPQNEIQALGRFNEISVFHEQNHRMIWRLMPPPPNEERDLSRYLNFAESLVVLLDLALGDQLGPELSPVFERLQLIYRSGDGHSWRKEKPKIYRDYLLSLFVATYYLLEMMNPEDILPALNYLFPGQKKLNSAAVKRSLQLNVLFTRVTNPQWQMRFWKHAHKSLSKIHLGNPDQELYLPQDPLDLADDLYLVHRVLDYYEI